ncbi:AMP-binding protein [Amycolatopsis nigrescens]|uniref:AMP-binding protein n=1 Tax=Amycolatopsis nigrescens TaxID=381445 RepID=UPI001FE22C41|nr:AMP-binding protein [Amycolatopsis nigrescens]
MNPAKWLAHELGNVGVLVRTGFLRPIRPDTAVRLGGAALRWGRGPATLAAMAAIEHGHRTALVDERGALSFTELHRRSNALARALAADGLGPGDRIALICRNHRGFVDGLLAGAKLGADVLLMNTAFAAPQLASTLDRERATAVICDEEFADVPAQRRYLAWHENPVSAPTLDGLIEAGDPAEPAKPARTGQVIILTSGTTGSPKGVARPDPRSLDPVAGLVDRIPLPRRRAQLLAAPLFHTWGLSFLLLGLHLGTTQVLHRRFDPARALAEIEAKRCATFVPVPVMLRRILDLPGETKTGHDLSALRAVAAAGSALTGDLAAEWMDAFGDNLYNIYGSTEVALVSVATPADLRAAPGTAGHPARGTEVRLLDEHGEPVPDGETGRIFVANGGLFDGYTGGGGKEVVRGLMSTGDVGRFDESGRLFVRGRDDEMIVSGGENVFPAEVEDLLARHPSVGEAAAAGVPDEEFGQRLRAFVVLSGEATEDELKEYVKQNLAGYKTPREIRFLAELPRNATGKVLKRVLLESETE